MNIVTRSDPRAGLFEAALAFFTVETLAQRGW
jgi:hypothetical protein